MRVFVDFVCVCVCLSAKALLTCVSGVPDIKDTCIKLYVCLGVSVFVSHARLVITDWCLRGVLSVYFVCVRVCRGSF